MMKRVIALTLCLLMIVPVFAGCANKADAEEDPGAYVYMYLADQVYDLDPAYAYNNESALKVVSLVFDSLFTLDSNGKVKKSLVKKYVINEDDNTKEYEMILTLNDTCWTDGTQITANDIYFAWTRLLQPDNSFEAASLLFDVKNARAAKEGLVSIDDVGISAINEKEFRIYFEGKIDYDQFLLNLTSHALAPLREDIVSKSPDWAKKPATICSNGPFRLREVSYAEGEERLILERNPYYYRDITKDPLDKAVRPFRLVVDYTMTDEEILAAYNEGKLFYMGDIPLSVRASLKDQAEVKDALSTHTYVLNENAVIQKYSQSGFKKLSETKDLESWKKSVRVSAPTDDPYIYEKEEVKGDKIFADPKVRQAMSIAIDRNAIAEAVVFAKAATGIVPSGVYDSTSKRKLFREVGGDILSTSANMDEAKKLLAEAGINPSDYMFAISVAAYDDVHMKIAEMVQASWEELGFHVAIKPINAVVNTDYLKTIEEVPKDIRDDLFAEAYRAGEFEVAAIDYRAISVDAFSMLAPFAKAFTGRACTSLNSSEFNVPAHITGYNSEEYNAKIEAAFAEKDIKKRAVLLHEAEQILLKDLPVIPIVFNQDAILTRKDLSKVKYTYYGTPIFTKAKLKNYELYVSAEEA
jgi:oligopeptide transport system substrate-binding protein